MNQFAHLSLLRRSKEIGVGGFAASLAESLGLSGFVE